MYHHWQTTCYLARYPMPPHHPLLGHIALSARVLGGLPKDAHGPYLADQIDRMYPDMAPVFYLDTWRFGPPVLVVILPDVMCQYTQDRYLQKHVGCRSFWSLSLVSMTWSRWKTRCGRDGGKYSIPGSALRMSPHSALLLWR